MGVDLGSPALLYIAQEVSLLVGYNVRVLVGLQDINVTRITWEEFLVGLYLLPSLWSARELCPTQGGKRQCPGEFIVDGVCLYLILCIERNTNALYVYSLYTGTLSRFR